MNEETEYTFKLPSGVLVSVVFSAHASSDDLEMLMVYLRIQAAEMRAKAQ